MIAAADKAEGQDHEAQTATILLGRFKNRDITDLPDAYLQWLTVRAQRIPREVKLEASRILEQRERVREKKLTTR